MPMSDHQAKQCPVCAESIPGAAKVCPRCRTWLTWWSFYNPTSSAFVMAAMILSLVGLLSLRLVGWFGGIFNPPPYYAETAGGLRVLDSHFSLVETKDGQRIYVLGVLTNESAVPWKEVELQCRFLDESGRMIDAAHPVARLTILPGCDSAFRAVVTSARQTKNYQKVEVTVSTARNVKGAF